jgi:hypothetical protein
VSAQPLPWQGQRSTALGEQERGYHTKARGESEAKHVLRFERCDVRRHETEDSRRIRRDRPLDPGYGLADTGPYPSFEYYEKHGADLLDVCYNRQVLSSSISSSILRRTTTVASTTVAGLTTTKTDCHPDQTLDSATQNDRSSRATWGRF